MDRNSSDTKMIKEAFENALKEIGGKIVGITANIPPLEHEHIEYEQQQDEENFYDKDSKCFIFEGNQLSYHKISQGEYSNNELTLSYFVDGSLRAHYWGDIVVGMRFFPIVLGETVVAVIKRNNVDFKTYGIERYVNIILPAETFTEISVFKENLQKNLENINYVRVVPVERAEEDEKSKNDKRMILLAKVRSILHSDECAIIEKICRQENEVIVLDGGLRSEIFKDKPGLIGIAKSFSLKPVINLPEGIRPLPEILSNLKAGYRTCVFAKETESQYKFWYLRLHPSDICETYFDGVVKIEVNQKSISSLTEFIDFVNTVSYLVYKERNPTSYPTRRWASHIYPIYIAEKLAKSNLTSVEVLRQKFKIV